MPNIGDQFTWKSRSRQEPHGVERTGTILALVPAGENPHAYLPRTTINLTARKFSEREGYDRWMVEVKRPRGGSHYYAPRCDGWDDSTGRGWQSQSLPPQEIKAIERP